MKQFLLSLPTYPDAPPLQTLESAAFLSRFMGAGLTAFIPQLSSNPGTWPLVMGAFPLDVPRLMDEAVLTSERNAVKLTETITTLCSENKVSLDVLRNLTTVNASSDALIDIARLHDLTLLPVPEANGLRNHTESVIFDAGRPVLLLPSGKGTRSLKRLETAVVAWDYSRTAARALADALPILKRAKRTHILSVFGEKGINTTCAPTCIDKYLAAHQVSYVREELTLKTGSIGEFVLSHAQEVGADLLVMGAYGHSRAREFVMGGATRGILKGPHLPVLLSH